jgi:HNH endonuclease
MLESRRRGRCGPCPPPWPDRHACAVRGAQAVASPPELLAATWRVQPAALTLSGALGQRSAASGRGSHRTAKLVQLYWPHTLAFVPAVGGPGGVLRQNFSGQAEIVSVIRRFRERHIGDRLATLAQARAAAPERFGRLSRTVEWKAAEMPLPRLQLVGNARVPFLYRLGWNETIRRGEFFADGFDRSVQLVPDAGDHLVALAPLLRPLIQRQWAAWIARVAANHALVQDAYLDDFLFGATRIPLDRVRPGLRELQRARCFYCRRPLRAGAEVDHFIPWSRYPDNGIHNLVLACAPCNNSKRSYLAAGEHVERWSVRLNPGSDSATSVAEIAEAQTWDFHPQRTLGVARTTYLHLPGDARLWLDVQASVAVSEDLQRIRRALEAGPAAAPADYTPTAA